MHRYAPKKAGASFATKGGTSVEPKRLTSDDGGLRVVARSPARQSRRLRYDTGEAPFLGARKNGRTVKPREREGQPWLTASPSVSRKNSKSSIQRRASCVRT